MRRYFFFLLRGGGGGGGGEGRIRAIWFFSQTRCERIMISKKYETFFVFPALCRKKKKKKR